jgi:hypothetical protein
MGDRRERSTVPILNADLVALTKKSIVETEHDVGEHVLAEKAAVYGAVVDDDDPYADWADDEPSPVIATGSQPEALPASSRTATLSDPLTTGLLAEVARRTETLELDPSTIEIARRSTQEINPAALAEVLRAAEKTPIPTEPVQHSPNIRRRTVK